jgi:Fur family transcriptional regulator, peroxide stress response regulator
MQEFDTTLEADRKRISMDKMRGYLESRKVKPSYQRLKILEYLAVNRNHPSVETIYKSLCGEIPTLSKTTVYNTLSLFTEKGIVSSLTIVNNELRYDLMFEPHAHFQCSSCGKLFDIPMKSDLFLTDTIEEHQVHEIQVTFKGTCKECTKNKKTLDKIS